MPGMHMLPLGDFKTIVCLIRYLCTRDFVINTHENEVIFLNIYLKPETKIATQYYK